MSTQAVSCPRCKAALRSSRPFPIDKQVRCPQCGTEFIAANSTLPSYLQDSLSPPPLPLPESASRDRTPVIVLAGVAALVLVGGGVTAGLLMHKKTEPPAVVKDEPKEPKDKNGDDERNKKLEEENRKLKEQLAANEEKEKLEKKRKDFERLMEKGKKALEENATTTLWRSMATH